jgi:uncharacterized protein YqhQ
MSSTPTTVGGQAVIEGVMMRGPRGYAISVRRANGMIQTLATPFVPFIKRFPVTNVPIVRGAVSLIEMMGVGLKSLEYSANEAAKDEPSRPSSNGNGKHRDAEEDGQAFSRVALAGTMAFSIAIGLFLFVVVPNLSTHFLGKSSGRSINPFIEEKSPLLYNLVSGAIRAMIIVGYIYAISLMKDVKRLFQYHGAEHKAVSAYEAGKELTVANVRPFTRLHPRCGTTFIAITMLVSIIVFAFFAKLLVAAWPQFFTFHFAMRKTLLISGHILMMPIVAGVCFELLRLGGKYRNNLLLKLLITPGYWFQQLTTREPDDQMIEVAIKALRAAMDIEVEARIEERIPAAAGAVLAGQAAG